MARSEGALPDGQPIFLALWQRARGGYTLSFSAWTGSEWREDAATVPSFEAAFEEAEALCARQAAALDAPVPEPASMAEQIAALAHRGAAKAAYLSMFGAALDGWVDLSLSIPTQEVARS